METPSLRQRWLGAKLADLRQQGGFTSLASAAAKTGRSTASLSRIENGIVVVPPRDVPPILDAYGVADTQLREKVMIVASEIQQERRGWWVGHGDALSPSYLDLIRLESTATEIWTYETHFVPGLLQTKAYARAVPAAREPYDPASLDQFVDIRMNRKVVLAREEPITLRAIISETALHHPIGGRELFSDQLQHLRQDSLLPNITVQVLPFADHAHPGMTGAFTLLRLPSLDVAHVEMLNSDAYIEAEPSTDQYRWAFERLTSLALTPSESDSVIAGVLDTL